MSTFEVYEHGLSPDEAEVLTWDRIGMKWLKFERSLYDTKWFDYRFLTPLDATLLYIRAFHDAYRDAYRANFDRAVGDVIRVVTPQDFFDNFERKHADLVGCWRGRQVADGLGMPYELYTSLAINFRLRYWKQRFAPKANMLYSEMIVEKVAEAWQDRQTARAYYSEHPNYRVENFRGTPAQIAHRQWLDVQARHRSDPDDFRHQMVRKGLLPD